jgi:hypothetical protein
MLVGLFAGCANSERVNPSVYEGLNARNAILNPSANHNPTGKPLPYQEYEAERKKRWKTPPGNEWQQCTGLTAPTRANQLQPSVFSQRVS